MHVMTLINFAQHHLWPIYKNSHKIHTDRHTSMILHTLKENLSMYLLQQSNLPNTSYFLFLKIVYDCSLLFDTPGIYMYNVNCCILNDSYCNSYWQVQFVSWLWFCWFSWKPGGGHLYFKVDIIRVKKFT